ncbi:MAG: SDR family oxidoreductase [Nocardiopsaceae bacterium]|nr:SDR family oxidoreductase [Nocardiopsaceae bacterium]
MRTHEEDAPEAPEHPVAVVAVVGAGSGIGRATARRLAAGARVIACDRDQAGLTATMASLPGDGHVAVVTDVTDRHSLLDAAGTIRRHYQYLTSLVVTAGLVDTNPAVTIPIDRARKVFDVNVIGTLQVVQALLPLLTEAPGPRSIVLFSSVAASVGGGLLGGSVYAASKAAVEGLARGLARELASSGIRVNAIAPGPVDTPMTNNRDTAAILAGLADATLVGRIATPEEIAASVAYLVGDSASFVTGHVLHANGGLHLSG